LGYFAANPFPFVPAAAYAVTVTNTADNVTNSNALLVGLVPPSAVRLQPGGGLQLGVLFQVCQAGQIGRYKGRQSLSQISGFLSSLPGLFHLIDAKPSHEWLVLTHIFWSGIGFPDLGRRV
jgi:hypothetical protein